MIRFTPIATLLALAACADSEAPEAMPTDDGGAYNVVAPVKAPLTDDGEPAIGQWIRLMQDEQPVLQFGPANTEPLVSLSCNPEGGIFLTRHGATAGAAGEMVTIAAGQETRELAVSAVQGPLPRVRASIDKDDNLLAQIARTGKPIELSMGDAAPLILPIDAAIGQFIEGCENPGAAARAEENRAVEANLQ